MYVYVAWEMGVCAFSALKIVRSCLKCHQRPLTHFSYIQTCRNKHADSVNNLTYFSFKYIKVHKSGITPLNNNVPLQTKQAFNRGCFCGFKLSSLLNRTIVLLTTIYLTLSAWCPYKRMLCIPIHKPSLKPQKYPV